MTTPLLPSVSRWLRPIPIHRALASPVAADDRICSWPWTVAGLVLVAGVVLFFRLGTFRTLGSHEVYAVVPAREMIETDNWILPKFGGVPRLRKPPLVYWIVARSGRLFGELTPLTARIPSAMAGLLLAGLMGIWAKRWYGPSVGWAAAFVQLTSVWFIIFARKAEIDMILCLLTSAMFLVALQPTQESSRNSSLRWLAFFALLSLAWMAKFHYGPAMVLAPVLVYLLIEKRWRQLKGFANPLGWLCFAAAITIWPLLVLEQAPNAWEIWRRETLGRAIGEMGKHPVFFYVPFLIWMPMPWTFFAMATVRNSWQAAWKSEKNSRERFLWVWFLVQLLIVTLSANKHKHYLLAMLPVLTLLSARSLSSVLHGFRRGRLRINGNWLRACVAVNLVIGGTLVLLAQKHWPELSGHALILGITIGGCQGAGWLLLSRRRVMAVVAVNVLSLAIGGVVVMGDVLPHCDRRVDIQAFAAEIRHNMLPKEQVCVYGMDRDPLVYHLGSPVFRRESREELEPTLKKHGTLFVVGYESQLQELTPIAQTHPLARLPKGPGEREPVEGDVVLVKLTPRNAADQK